MRSDPSVYYIQCSSNPLRQTHTSTRKILWSKGVQDLRIACVFFSALHPRSARPLDANNQTSGGVGNDDYIGGNSDS
jgi:hypothetical protein